jgi:hypothetical protein
MERRRRIILERYEICVDLDSASNAGPMPGRVVPRALSAPCSQTPSIGSGRVDGIAIRKPGAGGVRRRPITVGIPSGSWRIPGSRRSLDLGGRLYDSRCRTKPLLVIARRIGALAGSDEVARVPETACQSRRPRLGNRVGGTCRGLADTSALAGSAQVLVGGSRRNGRCPGWRR